MKFLNWVFKVLLPILLISITMSFVIENIAIKSINNDIISKKISGYFLDNIISDFDVDELGDIEDKIRTSEYTNKITSKYIDILIKNLVYNKQEDFNIADDIKEMIDKEFPNKFTEEKKKAIYENVQKQSSILEEKFENDLPVGLDDYNFTFFIKLYGLITNKYVREAIIIFLIIDIILLTILNKLNVFKYLQIGIIVTFVFSLVIYGLIALLSNFIAQFYSGGWIDNFNLDLLSFCILVELILIVILAIIRIIIKLNSRNIDKII